MGSRTLPMECEHGKVFDWGDFGPNQDDPYEGIQPCHECKAADAERKRERDALLLAAIEAALNTTYMARQRGQIVSDQQEAQSVLRAVKGVLGWSS